MLEKMPSAIRLSRNLFVSSDCGRGMEVSLNMYDGSPNDCGPCLLDLSVMMETLFPSLAIPATIAHLAQAPSLVLLAKTTHHSLKIPSTTACSVLQQAPSVMQPTAICDLELSMALSCLQGPVLCLEGLI
jgi:hypothetical protein